MLENKENQIVTANRVVHCKKPKQFSFNNNFKINFNFEMEVKLKIN